MILSGVLGYLWSDPQMERFSLGLPLPDTPGLTGGIIQLFMDFR